MRRAHIRVELPTVLLGLGVHALWLLLTLAHHTLPLWLVVLAGGWLIAWHGSLQHEAVHGHPFGHRALDAAFAGVPLALWLPFSIYRRTHLAHHAVPALTEPGRDPESFFVSGRRWRRAGRAWRAWRWAESTLLGRMTLGPWRVVASLFASELARLHHAPRSVLGTWGAHALAALPVVLWVVEVCDIPLDVYVLCYVYPGLALTLLRSFAEHRAEGRGLERSAIVEAEAPLAWLFLHNNLHALHHAEPWLPWYALPSRYRAVRERLLRDNDNYFFDGYLEVARRFLVRPKGSPVHPGAEGPGAEGPGAEE